MKSPEDYYSTHMVLYSEPEAIGFLDLEVLPFLKGRKWDHISLAFVHSLRPSSIRVTTGLIKCDARTWRVTVMVDENNIIEEITQEVEVGLPNDIPHGDSLLSYIKC